MYTHLGYRTIATPPLRNPASAILLSQSRIDWEEWKSVSGAPSFVIDNQAGKSVKTASLL